MTRPLSKFALAALALLLCRPVPAAPALSAVLRDASRDRNFTVPTTAELAQAEQLFAALLAGSEAPELPEMAARLGFDLLQVAAPDARVMVEKADARRGRGLYAFRAGYLDTLQIPHAFKDEMTRDIGLALFAEGRFGAAAWNTVPRFYDQDGLRIDADMAHLEATYFNAFTRAVARARPQATVLQIHGFEQGKRKTGDAAAADLILSAGHAHPPESLRKRWQCLLRQTEVKATLYPETSRELGGTTNSQVAVLKSLGYAGFIHAEMSRPLRLALRDNALQRKNLLACLQETPQ